MAHYVLTGLLLLVNVFVFSTPVPSGLSVSFLDVGQGDAVFIQSPTGVQVLVDGGATRAVLRELSGQMAFFDRTLDVIVATHPDQDHIGGLSDILARYDASFFIESGATNDTPAFRALVHELEESKVQTVTALRGMRLILGGGAYIDILFPDREVSGVESNTASVIMRVVYGETKFLITGDSPSSIEKYLVSLDGNSLQSDVLKAGHHGSKTSSDESFVSTVAPSYAVVSAGEDNRYGHPHQEVVRLFYDKKIPLLRTAEFGSITFVSDGIDLRIK